MMGRPKDFLNDVSSDCKGDNSYCVAQGKRACDALNECWGFAVNAGWGVQIYNAKASNSEICNGIHGLKQNGGWTTYRKDNGNVILYKSC